MANAFFTGVVAVGFALVHVLGSRLTFLRTVPRSAWLSLAGGVSVAYVFVHLLPELADHQETIGRHVPDGGLLGAIEAHAYLFHSSALPCSTGLSAWPAKRSSLNVD